MNQIHKEATFVGCLLVCIIGSGFLVAHEMRTTVPSTPSFTSPVNGGGSKTPATPTPETLATPAALETSVSSARLVFAADFSSNGGCGDHSTTDHCDLFTSDLDLTTGTTSNVVQITNTSVSESYPAWNPNGTVAYASVFETFSNKWIEAVDITTGKTNTLVSTATWPEVSPDGTTLLYATSDTHLLMTSLLTNGGLSIGSAAPLTGTKEQEDPDYATNGKAIVFHEIESDGAHGAVLDLTNGTTAHYTDRTGHCAFSGLGDFTVCDNSKGGGLFKRTYANGTLGESSLWIPDMRPSQLATYDPTFASCNGVSFNYPTFCGDDTHLLVSTSCNIGGTVTFSRLFLIDASGPSFVYHPIGASLAEQFNGSGMSSWTLDCLP